MGVTKPSKTDSGLVHTKEKAVAALRPAWEPGREWRAEVRALPPLRDAGLQHSALIEA